MKTILFDLDGTLLPLDLNTFIQQYFGLLVKRFANERYDGPTLVNAVWGSTKSMIENNGERTNYELFWETFSSLLKEDMELQLDEFKEFYENDFYEIKRYIPEGYTIKPLLDELKELGYTSVLATNPIFPKEASIARLDWIGASFDDFLHVTTMENSCYSKPNINYYKSLFTTLNLDPKDCLMVGNNAYEDACVEELGCKVFLVTEYLENEHNVDISKYPQGTLNDLLHYLKQ